MNEFFVHFFQALIKTHGSAGIFFIGFLEDILFFVPSSLVFMAAGFVLIPHDLKFWEALSVALWKVGLPASLGVTFGSLFVYGAVYFLGKPFVLKYGKYLGVYWDEIEKFQKKFAGSYSDEVVLFIARAIPIFPLSIASVAAGLVRLPWREFVAMTFTGVLIRAGGAAFIGSRVGKAYVDYAAQFETIEKYGVLLLALILVVFLGWHLRKHTKDSN